MQDDSFFENCILPAVINVVLETEDKVQRHTGTPGDVYLQELFDNSSAIHFKEVMRMSRSCFWKLHNKLKATYGLKDNRVIDLVQKLSIFIFVCKG